MGRLSSSRFFLGSSSIGHTASMDGLAIAEAKRGSPDSRWQKRLSASFACASLGRSLSFWLAAALYYVQPEWHVGILGWRWIDSIASWQPL